MERSGTTFLSQLISLHPDVVTGFECGLLLADSPSAFSRVPQWYNWLLLPVEHSGWGMTAEQRQDVVDSTSWAEAYAKLVTYAPGYTGAETWVVDKTPAYMGKLDTVLSKVDCPCLVTEKRIDEQYQSYRKRGKTLDEFARRYRRYYGGLIRAQEAYPDRIRVVPHEGLAIRTDQTLADVCTFIGLAYDDTRMRGERLSEYVEALTKRRRKGGSSRPYPVRTHYKPSAQPELDGTERAALKRLEDWRVAGGEPELEPVAALRAVKSAFRGLWGKR
jgi:hypothetical protein